MKVANIGGAKAAIVPFRGEKYYFLFNGYAMFDLEEEFGGREYTQKLGESGPAGLSHLLRVSTVLASYGELARREIGLTPHKDVQESDFGPPVLLQPLDILVLRNGCVEAINLGHTQELSSEDEEIDLGLIELQKKRKP